MPSPTDYRKLGCQECANGKALGFDVTLAFQPIVDVSKHKVFASEALARGLNGEGAGDVFTRVDKSNLYRFDQTCRTKAIKLASELNLSSLLSINFMPNAVYRPELCIRTTLAAAEQYQFPVEKIIFEITEGEEIDDISHMKEIVNYYQKTGFKTAIDDFGAGYAGLNLLADIQTDIIKLDMALIRNIDQRKASQAIVKGIYRVCEELDITIIAEGIETSEEFKALESIGINLMQGYYFAKPAFESIPHVDFEVLLD